MSTIGPRHDGDSYQRVIANLAEVGLLVLARNVCAGRRVRLSDVLGRSRCTLATDVRFELWNVVRDSLYPISYPELGRLFDRDHTTIMSGVARRQCDLVAEIGRVA